jgi:micrococcal nuclease
MYEYNAKVVNVVDGDTFDLDIDLGFHIHIHERIRVLELDTPEKRGNKEKELGLLVTDFAKEKFTGLDVVIHSKTDSFGRWRVDVFVQSGDYAGQSITDIYTKLGVNKFSDNYSEENVKKIYN